MQNNNFSVQSISAQSNNNKSIKNSIENLLNYLNQNAIFWSFDVQREKKLFVKMPNGDFNVVLDGHTAFEIGLDNAHWSIIDKKLSLIVNTKTNCFENAKYYTNGATFDGDTHTQVYLPIVNTNFDLKELIESKTIESINAYVYKDSQTFKEMSLEFVFFDNESIEYYNEINIEDNLPLFKYCNADLTNQFNQLTDKLYIFGV